MYFIFHGYPCGIILALRNNKRVIETNHNKYRKYPLEVVARRDLFPFLIFGFDFSMYDCHSVIFYISIRFVVCSVDPEIPAEKGTCFLPLYLGSIFLCISVIPVVFYMFTGLVRC